MPFKGGAMLMRGFFSNWKRSLHFMLRNCAGGALVVSTCMLQAQDRPAGAPVSFGHANPFYAVSTLPFHAPAFDKIKNGDFQPAIEAGMAQQIQEMEQIANNPAA